LDTPQIEFTHDRDFSRGGRTGIPSVTRGARREEKNQRSTRTCFRHHHAKAKSMLTERSIAFEAVHLGDELTVQA
jgi:hypothetical protein